ncbi:MAG TPA: polyketide synthase dehydratase domain-containing protein [Syntrophales bacterium]|nr:polyketide synthase dehydratase domain-containing protein [Syntrophales bacterium]
MIQTPPRSEQDRDDAWVRLPRILPVSSYLWDHHFMGKTIFPAVEILQGLAATVLAHRPEARVTGMRNVSFDRFLEIAENDRERIVFHDLKADGKGLVSARLVTVSPSGKAGIRREKIHAMVDFTAPEWTGTAFPMDLAAALEGMVYRLPAEQLYRKLIPFGPAYRNLQGEVLLTENGGVAQVRAAEYPAPAAPLGSTFPFDGIMHIACAWSQRFHGIVAFPVGFGERAVPIPTVPGETYFCRVLPVSAMKEELIFDMAIYDPEGRVREFIGGMKMRDVSGGRVRPPGWVRFDGTDPLATIRKHCEALCVIEEAAVAGFAADALTAGERTRFDRMGIRRKKNYLMGRLALKILARKLAGQDRKFPASAIHTMMEDGVRPFCPDLASRGSVFCSLSHDRRFAVAVGGGEPMGIDVEFLSGRVLRARHLYMGETESTLADRSPLGVPAAALRVWSIKEGVTKALDMPIGEAWQRVRVRNIGEHESRLTVDGEHFAAFHDTVDDHVFTLVKRES